MINRLQSEIFFTTFWGKERSGFAGVRTYVRTEAGLAELNPSTHNCFDPYFPLSATIKGYHLQNNGRGRGQHGRPRAGVRASVQTLGVVNIGRNFLLFRHGRFYGIREYLTQLRPTRVQQQRDYHAPSLFSFFSIVDPLLRLPHLSLIILTIPECTSKSKHQTNPTRTREAVHVCYGVADVLSL